MTFKKYNVKDNAFSTLLVGISAGATSLQVQASAGDKFPAGNFIATLVQYEIPGDETSLVVKREKVLVSNNATDTFTITRGFDGDTPVSFNAGDFVYLNVVSAIIDDLQDETTRLESDKLNIATYNSTTRNNLTAYRLIYIDGTGTETQLALGTAGQVLISQGTTSNPIWQAPSVDIDGLTNDDTLAVNDKLVFFKSGTGNRKRTAKASETVEGLVERATNAEAEAGTDTTRYITPKQAKDNYFIKRNGNRVNRTVIKGGQSVGTVTGESFLVTDDAVAILTLQVGRGYAKLQVSENNIDWTDLYSLTLTSQTAQTPQTLFIIKSGLYYRGEANTTSDNTADSIVTLLYTS